MKKGAMKILLVDDDKNALTMLRLHLGRPGRSITAVQDAQKALDALAGERYDWLVVDGQIPPFDGLELADRAKKEHPSLRIVMVSGVYDKTDIAGHPIERLFQKPVDTDELDAYLRP